MVASKTKVEVLPVVLFCFTHISKSNSSRSRAIPSSKASKGPAATTSKSASYLDAAVASDDRDPYYGVRARGYDLHY